MPDLSLYKVGVVSSIQDCGSSKGKALRACRVNIGESEELTVVTAASNVREGSRYYHAHQIGRGARGINL
eukprot:scaffold448_cov156-Amphora_coffeaeformis.AAC.2